MNFVTQSPLNRVIRGDMAIKYNYTDFVTDLMDKANVPYRAGQRETGHWIFFPKTNLKPWTEEERKRIDSVISSYQGREILGTTQLLVRADWTSYETSPLKGMRIYVKGYRDEEKE